MAAGKKKKFSNNIIISEVLYNEPGGNTEAEWIQLYNPTKRLIDLEGWSFVKNNDQPHNKKEVHKIAYGEIESGETFLFGKSDFMKQYGRQPDQVLPDNFVLTNKRMILSLIDFDGKVVDEIGWGRDQWSHLRAQDNQSLLRIDDGTWIINTNPDLNDVSYLTASRDRDLSACTNVIISEVLYNEPGSNTDAEWIQLYNPTNRLVKLDGWDLIIYNNKIASEHAVSGFLGPGETFMLGKSDFRKYYGREADLEFDFVLTNKRLVLGLKDPNNHVVDKVGWNMEEWSHLRARDNQSLLRMDVDTWIVNTHSFTGNVGYSMWSGISKKKFQGIDHVIISQVLYNEPGSDTDQEWIQIYNPTDDAVNISDWTLVKNDDESGKEMNSPLTFLDQIEPGERLVFGKATPLSRDFHSIYGSYPDGTFDFDLTNKRMLLTLQDGYGEVVDEVGWQVPGWEHLRAGDGQSICRDESSLSWMVSDETDPFNQREDDLLIDVDICC